jgi:hypothetical protein
MPDRKIANMGEIHRLSEKKPSISEEQEERELQEAVRSASAPPKKTKAGDASQEPEAIARTPKKKREPSRDDQFYYCPSIWGDRAFDALSSASQAKLAFRLYRRWKTQAGDGGLIVASSVALGIDWRDRALRRAKATMLHTLEEVKLIRVESRGSRRAPRVRILE